MFGGPIQFGGLASGLDTQAIIAALVNAEAAPIKQLEGQKSSEKAKISLLGTLEGHLKALKSKAEGLATLGGLQSIKVQTSVEGIASFIAKGEPLPASYSLEVLALAAADRWAFAGAADATTDLGAGTVDFTYDGQAHSVTIAAADSSLNEIAEAINEQAGTAVTATVVNTGTSASPSWQLIVAGKSTGADHAITGLASSVAGLSGATQISTAANAEFELDGLAIQRSSNTFSDVVDGVEITLESVSATPVQVSLGIDTDGIKEKLKAFVDAFNEVAKFINAQSQYSEEGGPGGALFGDPVLKTIRSRVSEALYGAQSVDSTSSFGSLGMLGVKLQTDGTLLLDESKVDAKIAEDVEAFLDYFADLDGFDNGGAAKGTSEYYQDTTTDKGLFMTLTKSIDRMLDSQTVGDGQTYKGLIASRKESLEKIIGNIDDRVEQLELRLEAFEANLVARFTALEKLMSGLQSQSAFMSQQLGQTSG